MRFIAGKEEYEYNLDALTMIEATDSFISQDEDVRGCQLEPLFNCTTRKYLKALLDRCGCLPLSINNKVVFEMYFSICNTSRQQKNTQEPLCSSRNLECVRSINVSSFTCLPPCSGLFVTSFQRFKAEKELTDVFPHKNAYNNYKKITEYPSAYSSSGKYVSLV